MIAVDPVLINMIGTFLVWFGFALTLAASWCGLCAVTRLRAQRRDMRKAQAKLDSDWNAREVQREAFEVVAREYARILREQSRSE